MGGGAAGREWLKVGFELDATRAQMERVKGMKVGSTMVEGKASGEHEGGGGVGSVRVGQGWAEEAPFAGIRFMVSSFLAFPLPGDFDLFPSSSSSSKPSFPSSPKGNHRTECLPCTRSRPRKASKSSHEPFFIKDICHFGTILCFRRDLACS